MREVHSHKKEMQIDCFDDEFRCDWSSIDETRREENEGEDNSIDCNKTIAHLFCQIVTTQEAKTLSSRKKTKNVRQETFKRKEIETLKRSRASNHFKATFFDRNLL